MKEYPCLKVSQVIPLVKKLEKIKIVITNCADNRNERIENIFKNELDGRVTVMEKKNLLKELDKKLYQMKNIYAVIHNKLYDVVETIHKCECCVNPSRICKGRVMCLKSEENKKLWEEMDKLSVSVLNFYEEVESKLVLETELCFHLLNKIKKIKFFEN